MNKTKLNQLSEYAFDFIKTICEKFGPRYSCSKEERAANEWVKEEYDTFCDETHIEEFNTHPELYPQGIIKVAGVLGIIGLFFFPFKAPWNLLSSLMIILALGQVFVELFLIKRWIKFLFKEGTSTNTWGRIKPSGEVKFRIIYDGHIDSAKEMRLMNGDKNPPLLIGGIAFLYFVFTLILPIIKYGILISSKADEYITKSKTPNAIVWTNIDTFYYYSLIILIPCFLYFIWGMTGNNVVMGAGDNLSGVSVSAAVGKYFSENRLKNTEIILLSAGSEEEGDQGAQAWVDAHSDILSEVDSNAYVIDSAGAGKEIYIIEVDKQHRVKYHPEVIERMKNAYDLHKKEYPDAIKKAEGSLPMGSSDACMYTRAGFKSAFLVVTGGKSMHKPVNWHSMTDTWDTMEKPVLRDMVGMAIKYAEIVDKEIQ